MSRRTFLSSIGALVADIWFLHPNLVVAQQPGSPRRVGVLLVAMSPDNVDAQQLRHALRDAGYIEGRDVKFEWRSAEGDYSRIPFLVAETIKSNVDVIVVESTPGAIAICRATSTIPIVIAVAADPLGSSLVKSLIHPGGNVTGLSRMMPEIDAKRLQLLKETVPSLKRLGVFRNPGTQWHEKIIENLKAVAPALSIEPKIVSARTPAEINAGFAEIVRANAQALYQIDDAFFYTHRTEFIRQASKARLPAIYVPRQYPDEGGLMSFGTNIADLFRRSAGFVDKILKGAKPGDLPIEQPTKFEFVVNLKTAKALGITVPQAVLLQADEVIR